MGIARWHNILIPFFYFLLPVGLVLLQPDLGSALILFGIWVGYLFISGARKKHLLIGLIIFALAAAWGWQGFLKDYQQQRIIGLFRPDYDPLGINYNVIQSKIAIGSAGFFGKGYQQGTQVQLGFLPEAATDFIFAAYVEEWGFVGAAALLAAFLTMIFRIIAIGVRGENNFTKLICLGTVAVFVLHFVFNVFSNIGLLPVIGLPFPFFSYGGSSLLTNAVLVGIIQSIVIKFSF